MKQFIFIISFATIMFANLFGQWQVLNLEIDEPLLDVQFVNEKVGWIAASNKLLKTEDGGDSWTQVNLNENWKLYKFNFFNENLGIAVCNSDTNNRYYFLITVNGGNSWSLSYILPESYSLSDISFANDTVITITGIITNTRYCAGWVLRTFDGGNRWDEITPVSPMNHIDLNFVYFFDADEGLVAGRCDSSLKLLRTGNGGATWQEEIIGPFTDISKIDGFFTDKNHGWIVGNYTNYGYDYTFLLLKTRNAGQTWQHNSYGGYYINDIFFADSLHGWVVGVDTNNHGIILETVDGADNWKPQVEKLSRPVNAIFYKNGTVWAVGDSGLFLRYNSITQVFQFIGETYPNSFILYQNFPNPFNPTTRIKFALPKTALTKIIVYDILGRGIHTLINKELKGGYYEINFDADDLPSGVYFYRIQAGNFIQTKKMILLK